MAEQAELAFVKNLVSTLSAQPITFANDFQQLPEHQLPKVQVLRVAVPPPPVRAASEGSSSIGNIQVTFKQLKPSFSLTLAVSPADSIESIKRQIASQPGAPPADSQRLLLKGKALADTKLLKEYNVKEGDTVNIMSKPTTSTPPLVAPQPKPAPSLPTGPSLELPPADSTASAGRRKGHGRIPSVVLSPSPSPSMDGEEVKDIALVDENGVTLSAENVEEPGPVDSTYRATISRPEYWEKLYEFIVSQFSVRADAHMAFEDYLNASKGALTASEIALIRDTVGVTGMGGA
ncbi:ubiquitin-like protein [Peniophora sp. CONT]|nr:ubiquitin-like protein [Peniophora sp. CONT]